MSIKICSAIENEKHTKFLHKCNRKSQMKIEHEVCHITAKYYYL